MKQFMPRIFVYLRVHFRDAEIHEQGLNTRSCRTHAGNGVISAAEQQNRTVRQAGLQVSGIGHAQKQSGQIAKKRAARHESARRIGNICIYLLGVPAKPVMSGSRRMYRPVIATGRKREEKTAPSLRTENPHCKLCEDTPDTTGNAGMGCSPTKHKGSKAIPVASQALPGNKTAETVPDEYTRDVRELPGNPFADGRYIVNNLLIPIVPREQPRTPLLRQRDPVSGMVIAHNSETGTRQKRGDIAISLFVLSHTVQQQDDRTL